MDYEVLYWNFIFEEMMETINLEYFILNASEIMNDIEKRALEKQINLLQPETIDEEILFLLYNLSRLVVYPPGTDMRRQAIFFIHSKMCDLESAINMGRYEELIDYLPKISSCWKEKIGKLVIMELPELKLWMRKYFTGIVFKHLKRKGK